MKVIDNIQAANTKIEIPVNMKSPNSIFAQNKDQLDGSQ